jgi:hypothetical protein
VARVSTAGGVRDIVIVCNGLRPNISIINISPNPV